MVLGDSNIAFTEKSLPEKPPYSMTYYEWLSVNGERILKVASTSGSSASMYQIPEGYVFFLVSCQLTCVNYGATNTTIGLGLDYNLFLRIATRGLVAGTQPLSNSISNSYPIPIMIEGGEDIRIGGNTNISVAGVIYGFLVKKDII